MQCIFMHTKIRNNGNTMSCFSPFLSYNRCGFSIMFSGIIASESEVLSIHEGIFTLKNVFRTMLTRWESISHDGVCVTILDSDRDTYSFFAMEETFRVTNFGSKKVGDTYNVERSLQLGDRIDGHMVSWHIDTLWDVRERKMNPDGSLTLWISFPREYANYCVYKWSIALNGVSLTIIEVILERERAIIHVSLIPLTQEVTNLGWLEKGAPINIEFDMIGKYVASMLNKGLLQNSVPSHDPTS